MAKRKDYPLIVEFSDDFGIDQIEQCYATLNSAFQDATELTIDLTKVTSIDTSGVQLLIAAKKEAVKTKVPLTIKGDILLAIPEYKDFFNADEIKNQDFVIKSSQEGGL